MGIGGWKDARMGEWEDRNGKNPLGALGFEPCVVMGRVPVKQRFSRHGTNEVCDLIFS